MVENAENTLNGTALHQFDSTPEINESVRYTLPFCRTHLAQLISQSENTSRTSWSYTANEKFTVDWIQVLLPVICSLGITGNLLNLLVLTKQRLKSQMRKLERSANLGLTALALSDLLFALMVFPHTFLNSDEQYVSPDRVLVLYYKVYGISIINMLLMSSTWLIVMLAVDRYIVLFYPLKAKCILGLRRTKFIIFAIIFVAAASIVPFLLNLTIQKCDGIIDNQVYYEMWHRWDSSKVSVLAYGIYVRWIWPLIAVFVPLSVLCYCNYKLVQGLKRAPIDRKHSCPGQTIKGANNRITLTLVVMVFLALGLITPAEVLKLVNPYASWGEIGHNMADFANMLQAFNFSFNFVLYVAIDNNFRLMCRNILLGLCFSKAPLVAETEDMVLDRIRSSNRDKKSLENLYG